MALARHSNASERNNSTYLYIHNNSQRNQGTLVLKSGRSINKSIEFQVPGWVSRNRSVILSTFHRTKRGEVKAGSGRPQGAKARDQDITLRERWEEKEQYVSFVRSSLVDFLFLCYFMLFSRYDVPIELCLCILSNHMQLITFWSNPPRQLIVIKSGVEDGHPFVPAGHAGPKQAGQKRPAEDESLGDLRS